MEKNDNISALPNWLNSVLISLLLLVGGATFFQNRQTHNSVEVLQIETAILTTKLSDHFNFAETGMVQVNSNTDRITEVEKTMVSEDQILIYLSELRKWIDDNYEKK